MRNYAVFLWLALVIGGTILAVARKEPAPDMPAITTLPQNTLLLPGQFVPQAMEMHYVLPAAGIPAKSIIKPADLSPVPVLPSLPPDRGLAAVPIAWTEIQAGLNAGQAAKLCRETTDLAKVSVQAVRCDATRPTPKCDAVLAVPLAPDGVLKELAKPEKLRVAATC